MQVYNEKEQVGQKEIKNVHFKEKESTWKSNDGSKVCAERDKKLKKGLIINGIKRVVRLKVRQLPGQPSDL